MMRVQDLVIEYGRIRAIDGVTLEISAGEMVALMGANGAGKSTLLNGILGSAQVTSGVVLFHDEDVTRRATQERVARGMGMVPEGRGLFPSMTVLENLTMGAYPHLGRLPRPPADTLARVFRMFPRLADRQAQQASTLSGGEQQMLAIGKALMGRPSILVCDEPSTGLAPMLVRHILQTLRTLCDEGTTILLAEQNAAAALKVVDRGYVLETGRVTRAGTAAELASDRTLVQAYLGTGAQG